MIESEIGVMPLLEQGHMLSNKANIENLEKAMNLNLPWSFQKKKYNPANTLILFF